MRANRTSWAGTRQYVQALDKPKKTNTQAPITIESIYLTVNFKKIKGGMLFWILNLDYPSPEEKSLIYQSKIWLLKPWVTWQKTIKSQLLSLKKSQECYYTPIIGWQECIIKIKNTNESEDIKNDEQNSHKDDIEQYERVDAKEHCK